MSDKADVHAHAAEYAHTAGYAHTLSTDGVRYPLSDSNAGDPDGHEHPDANTLPGDNHRYAHLYANTYTDADTDCHAVPNKRVSNSDT